jgi:hypothetical protein
LRIARGTRSDAWGWNVRHLTQGLPDIWISGEVFLEVSGRVPAWPRRLENLNKVVTYRLLNFLRI